MGVRKSKQQEKYDKTSGLCAYEYTPTDNQTKAFHYCLEKEIRISPWAAEAGPTPFKWFVGISDPQDFNKVYKSRFQYDNQQIWEAVYESMEYYYNKSLQ